MDQAQKKRIYITDRDPYVYQRARSEAARLRARQESVYKARRESRQRPECDARALHRRQSVVLGLLFAALAFVIWSGARITAPRLLVVTHGQEGTVFTDSLKLGRSGEVIALKPGVYEVSVVFDDSRFAPSPPTQLVKTGYSLHPFQIEFHASMPMHLKTDSTLHSSPHTSRGE